ncbi:MAG: 2-amino-4-hydroxy-6-hydroxymethyldihydropteridine diphosphokinase [Candidatus Omnitrophica bacterium]|nr:2-amino-4-hydroxy-6-hydroxymethyldihydropteridine diphosphokinase [Candidatus Omnitrophota bacterium]
MAKVYIAIGSNKGNRVRNVITALKKMEKGLTIKKISPFFTTPPEEGADGGFFINSVIEVETKLSPENLLIFLKEIEKGMGRKFPHKTGDKRTIDLDIILYGNKVIKTGVLIVPHPRYRKRYFVIYPLYEIAPLIKDPETGESISAIYRRLISNEDSKENR